MIRILTAVSLFAVGTTAQTWQVLPAPTAPPARAQHSLSFDGPRGRTVLFGGYDGNLDRYFDDTWEYDGTTWQNANLPGPSARSHSGMCFDSARGVTVLFGGSRYDFWGNGTYFGDTWEYDGSAWRQLQLPVAPAPRSTVMAYDSRRQVSVLFGGIGRGGGFSGDDTWEYDGVAWTQRSFAVSPPSLSEYRMAFDRSRGVMVLYPGYMLGMSMPIPTWEYDGVRWTSTQTATVPVLTRPAMAYDAARRRVVLTGSWMNTGQETWEYDGTDWSLVAQAGIVQSGTTSTALSYDSARGAIVGFGGELSSFGFSTPNARTAEYALRASTQVIGSSCGIVSPLPRLALQAGSAPRLGTTLVNTVADAGNGLVLLVVGTQESSWYGVPVPIPLDGVGLSGCVLRVGPEVVQSMAVAGGVASLSVPLPQEPELQGLVVVEQALELTPQGATVAVTQALRLTLGL